MLTRKHPLLLALAFLVAVCSAEPARAAEETLPALVRRVKPTVVSVITYNSKGETLMTGSGFFIRPGEVVTNLHVVEGAHRVEVRTFDGKGRTYPVEGLRAMDDDGDLVVLSVGEAAERARLIELAAVLPEEGESIFVIGNPLRLEGSVADGIVSAVREVPNVGRIIQITAPISHGNSGSPVFNMRGQVVGVVTIKVTNGQNINLAMGAARVAALRADAGLTTFEEAGGRKRRGGPQGDGVSDWWYKNGLNSLWLGNYDSALNYFESAVVKNPNRVEAWIQVGFCKVKQGKNNDAIRAFQQALKLRPNSYEAHSKLGDAYYYSGQYYKAIDSFKRAAELRPDMAEAHYNLAVTYLEIGDRASAAAESNLLKTLDKELHAKLAAEMQR
ncbi:MAG TPA: trypsin-like peptidase domain-containing protein [Pyrinomonadaceae bacterium]|nr:trypsin-like peptidase domain-containing protein [Pyrinomonadaceae bacterium]